MMKNILLVAALLATSNAAALAQAQLQPNQSDNAVGRPAEARAGDEQ